MTSNPTKLKIRQPDDWHVHLRDNTVLRTVLPYTSIINNRAIIMPNIIPPITSIKSAIAYRQRIVKALPANHTFNPLMTCYLNESINPNELELGYREEIFFAAKLYPINSTTNSNYGVTSIPSIIHLLERMQKINMPLLIHCELVDSSIDIFDREAYFIENILEPLRIQLPNLKVVLEHITTKESAEYISEGNSILGATITPHHLMFNRNDMLAKGLRPHLYCFPILKRQEHQKALHQLIISGNRRVFIGTDTAPHTRSIKESNCASAGIFNSPTALPAYATVFDELNALEHLEKFCSENGPNFYGLPLNNHTITLVRKLWTVEKSISNNMFVPFLAGETLKWFVEQ